MVCADTADWGFRCVWIDEIKSGNIDGRVVVKISTVWLALADAESTEAAELEEPESDGDCCKIDNPLKLLVIDAGTAVPALRVVVREGSAVGDIAMDEPPSFSEIG